MVIILDALYGTFSQLSPCRHSYNNMISCKPSFNQFKYIETLELTYIFRAKMIFIVIPWRDTPSNRKKLLYFINISNISTTNKYTNIYYEERKRKKLMITSTRFPVSYSNRRHQIRINHHKNFLTLLTGRFGRSLRFHRFWLLLHSTSWLPVTCFF